jgi:hypothetical protein
MATVHRFAVAAIAVVSSLVWVTHVDPGYRFGTPAVLTADAVIPAHAQPNHASAVGVDECSGDNLALRELWQQLVDLLLRHLQGVARWLSSGERDADSPVEHRSPDGRGFARARKSI